MRILDPAQRKMIATEFKGIGSSSTWFRQETQVLGKFRGQDTKVLKLPNIGKGYKTETEESISIFEKS